MSNIRKAFEKEKAMIPFITCGDPDLETTKKSIKAAVKNGADMIKLRIPFSDPTMEGPKLQEASLRALSGGVTTDHVFSMVKELREEIKIPMIFMTYANVVFSYGIERFVAACKEVGIDGLILPDVPYEEKEEFGSVCREYGVDFISMITQTTKERIARIAREAEGFLYLEGSKTMLSSVLSFVRQYTCIPCVVNVDEVAPEQHIQMLGLADGIILNIDQFRE